MNSAGINHEQLRNAWPVYYSAFSGSLEPVDPAGMEVLRSVYVASWLADAAMLEEADDSGRDLTFRGSAVSHIVLAPPLAPHQLLALIAAAWSADRWYSLVESDGVPTPPSSLLRLRAGQPLATLRDAIQSSIARLGGEAFVRMDHASSKTVVPCSSYDAVEANLRCSERTAARLRGIEAGAAADGPAEGYVMLRRWVDDLQQTHLEARVFVHAGVARGVSLTVRQHSRLGEAEERACIACLASLKRALRAFAKRVILATEYRDCVLDVAVPIAALDAALHAANRPSGMPSAEAELLAGLWLVECNTPVYLLATSGCFDLSNEADREILCGDAVDAEVVLPVLLAEFEWRTWRIELRQ